METGLHAGAKRKGPRSSLSRVASEEGGLLREIPRGGYSLLFMRSTKARYTSGSNWAHVFRRMTRRASKGV